MLFAADVSTFSTWMLILGAVGVTAMVWSRLGTQRSVQDWVGPVDELFGRPPDEGSAQADETAEGEGSAAGNEAEMSAVRELYDFEIEGP